VTVIVAAGLPLSARCRQDNRRPNVSFRKSLSATEWHGWALGGTSLPEPSTAASHQATSIKWIIQKGIKHDEDADQRLDYVGLLWSGGILIFAVERTNLWQRMPLEQYAVDFRRSLFRADPMMPILGVTAGAGATFFALNRSGAATVFAWAGIGFIVLVVVASITIAEPINSKFRRLPEGQMPERAEHYRTLWRRFHAARNLAALAALACLAAAAVA
jgi:hypothetical protein